MISGFKFAFRPVIGIELVMEATIGERPQRRLWKNKNRRATCRPLVVRR
jgi:hypothetical protein